MQVRANFLTDDNHISSSLSKGFNIILGIRNHQMGFERCLSAAPYSFDDQRPHRNVRNEVTIHNVDLDAPGTSRFGFAYLFTETSEICGQDRRNDLNHSHLPLNELL